MEHADSAIRVHVHFHHSDVIKTKQHKKLTKIPACLQNVAQAGTSHLGIFLGLKQ